jgi:DNA-directed RNA polymerase specialized sigma24 family protein
MVGGRYKEMTVATRKKGARPAKNTPERCCDAVYWQMFRVESGRPDAELCLAVTLLRAWIELEEYPPDSEPRQWLRNISPVCMEMLESLRASRAAEGSPSCGEEQGREA